MELLPLGGRWLYGASALVESDSGGEGSSDAKEAPRKHSEIGPTRKRPRIDARRILGPEDFEKIQRLKEQYHEMQKKRGGGMRAVAFARVPRGEREAFGALVARCRGLLAET